MAAIVESCVLCSRTFLFLTFWLHLPSGSLFQHSSLVLSCTGQRGLFQLAGLKLLEPRWETRATAALELLVCTDLHCFALVCTGLVYPGVPGVHCCRIGCLCTVFLVPFQTFRSFTALSGHGKYQTEWIADDEILTCQMRPYRPNGACPHYNHTQSLYPTLPNM